MYAIHCMEVGDLVTSLYKSPGTLIYIYIYTYSIYIHDINIYIIIWIYKYSYLDTYICIKNRLVY